MASRMAQPGSEVVRSGVEDYVWEPHIPDVFVPEEWYPQYPQFHKYPSTSEG